MRTNETAKIINEILRLQNDIIVYNELKECGSGRLSGLTKTDSLKERFIEMKKELESKINDPIQKNEEFVNIENIIDEKLNIGLESYESVLIRSKIIIEEIKKSNCTNIIIVSHNGLLSTLIAQMYNIPKNTISCDNCSISYHTYNNNVFTMISQPNNKHLYLMELD